MVNRPFVAALAAALCLVPCGPTIAGEPIAQEQIVHYADLDLSNPRDIERLDRRIWRTARKLCGSSSRFDIEGIKKDRICVATAVMRARAARKTAIDRAQSKTDSVRIWLNEEKARSGF